MLLQFSFEWKKEDLDIALEAIEQIVPVVSWKENGPNYTVEGVFEDENKPELIVRLEILCSTLEIETPKVVFSEVEEKDWVAENQKSFSPMEIGPFFIYGSHIKTNIPEDKILLLVDASCAFGSGQHESTRGCLMAIDKYSCKNPLDLGTGSGILALAIAKRHGCPVTACDNDPDSVRITIENAKKNNVANLQAYLSEGFASEDVQKKAPYDFIVANILAKPLCFLAADIAKHLDKKGTVVLSGLLNEQSAEVKKAYEKVGLHLLEETSLGEWTTLILRA